MLLARTRSSIFAETSIKPHFNVKCIKFDFPFQRKKDEYLHKWEETSKEVIAAFLKYFGSPIDEFWNRGKRRITQVRIPAAERES